MIEETRDQGRPGRRQPVCHARTLELVAYKDGLRLQRALVEARRDDRLPDTLLFLEHPPTITVGARSNGADILAAAATLAEAGIEVATTNRGGQITYHGPGQLIGYPIINLKPDRCDAHRYLRDLEETIIRTLRDHGIRSGRIDGLTGVWVGEKKIAAIGVRLKNWVTSHGFALNVNNDLGPFELINPCGLNHDEYGVTSMKEVCRRSIEIPVVAERLAHHFADVFDRRVAFVPPDQETIQVVVLSAASPEPDVLLLKRAPGRGDFWQPVTGRIEPGESPGAAAARELEEETGLVGRPGSLDLICSFLISPPLVRTQRRAPLINTEHSFWLGTDRRQLSPRSEEHVSARWLPLSEARELVPWETARRALDRAAERVAERASRG